MKNIIDAKIEFYFRGELVTAEANIELDSLINRETGLPQLHQILAQRNNIDLMSYHYEIMLEENVLITNAQGIVEDFVVEERLDEDAFVAAWFEQKMLNQLQAIAQQHLAIDDLQKNPKLKTALTAAFKLGKNAA